MLSARMTQYVNALSDDVVREASSGFARETSILLALLVKDYK